jgi:hypothetical protein
MPETGNPVLAQHALALEPYRRALMGANILAASGRRKPLGL